MFGIVLAEVIRQGIHEKLFKTDYPLELAEFILIGINFLSDSAVFLLEPEEISLRMKTMADIMEAALQVE